MQLQNYYQRYFSPQVLVKLLTTFFIMFASIQAYADDKISYVEKLNQKLSDPLLGQQTIITAGEFEVEGHWTPQEFNPIEINEFTRLAFDIGNWNFETLIGDATVLNLDKRRAVFKYKNFNNNICKVSQWLTITLEWDNNSVSFHVKGETTQFLVSPIAIDFFPDPAGPVAGSTVGGFRLGNRYGSFTLPLKGTLSVKEKTAVDTTVYQLKRVKLSAEGSWQEWVNNNLELSSTSMSMKGICIEDRSSALAPSANYPIIATDTFPSVWPETAFPVENIRTFSYSVGSVPSRDWVLWAIQHNIKVLVGLTFYDYAAELAALSADYQNADPYLRSCFEKNILAYAVGNEIGTSEIPLVIEGIEATKNLITQGLLPNKPVSTVLNVVDIWILNTYPPQDAFFTDDCKTLLPYMDILMFNSYGGYFFYDPTLLQSSLSWTSNGQVFSVLLNQFGALRSAAIKADVFQKPLWITETGWSSGPLTTHPDEPAGWSSPSHLKSFYRNFLTFDQTMPYFPQQATQQVQPPEMIFYFGLRDSFFPFLNVEEYFGLYRRPPYLLQKDL